MISITGGYRDARSCPARRGIQKPDPEQFPAGVAGASVLIALGLPPCRSCRFCCSAVEPPRLGGRRKKERAEAMPSDGQAAAKKNVESLLRVEPLAIEVGLGLVGLVGGRNRHSAAHLPPPAACRRPRVSSATGTRYRQSVAAQPRVCDLSQGRRDLALRAAAGMRARDTHRCGGNADGRADDARSGLRDVRAVDSGRPRGQSAECGLHRGG